CFDQPNLKARVSLSLELPVGWVAVANGAPLDASDHHTAGSARFAETQPISTYLISFAAGRFQVDSAHHGGRVLHMYHRETDLGKVARNRDAIFDLHARALAWMEAYTGIPYPFGKFAFVLLPAFQFGGMEHPGAVFYRAGGLMLEESATQNQILGRASVIAHETAHMWFGDLVTMEWFNDVWMKEVFANFMAAKIVNPSFPDVNHQVRFYLAHFPAAYGVDRTEGANSIRQPLDNLRNAGTLYGPIIYQKAPIVMRQLELAVGEEPFRDGLREYLDRYRFGNATWDDLITILDRRSSADLRAWSRVWVEEPGRPRLSARVTLDPGRRIERLEMEQADPAFRGRVWSQRFSVMLLDRDTVHALPVRLVGPRVVVESAAGLPAPELILPGADGLAYGQIVLDSASAGYLLQDLPALADPVTRAVGWVTLWDGMLERQVDPGALLELMARAIPAEPDELNLQRILGYLPELFWRFQPTHHRAAAAARMETTLWRAVTSAPSPRVAAALFRGYESVAWSPQAVRRLTEIWSGAVRVPGLNLAEPDFTRIALGLAVREVAGWDRILERQAERIQNPDRRAQFAFVRPAASPVPAVRDAFFQGLRAVEARDREPWVLEALGLLNHPLRAQHAERYVVPALELLEEIQRTGDIFFPSGWLDAVLSGHRSPEVAGMVRDFLAGRPGYPPRLRAKILQAADLLFRAAVMEASAPALAFRGARQP
ncbi:MAG TPA: M1 family aminopeptidase, partial [Gemmatimonadales bacterium]|nr:M1 family aminopeptidase [Gemmatimonadales bacterium]